MSRTPDQGPRRGVVLVSHTAEPGGAELALARYLRASTRDDVELVTLEGGPLWAEVEREGVPVRVLRPGPGGPVGQVRALARELRRGRPRLVVGNSMRAAFYAALALPRGVPLVYWVRDGLTESSMSRVNLLATRAVTLRRSIGYLANSEWTARTVRQLVPDARTEVVISPSGISPDVTGTSRALPAGQPVRLLYLGRLAPWKGAHLAVEALERLTASGDGRDYRLTVAGGALFDEQDYARRLREQVDASPAGDRIDLLGHVADPYALFAEHDVLVHCSVVPEPFGQVVVQGMSAGLAVVAADAGGPREVIAPGEDGLLYPMGDVAGIVSSVRRLVDDPALFAEVSAGAVKTSARYGDHACAERIDAALDSFLGPDPGTRS